MGESLQSKISGDVIEIAVPLDRLDAASSAPLKNILGAEIPPSLRRAEVDLGRVQFIDSSGVGLLLSLYRKLPQGGAEVVLRNVQPGVRAVLELLRLHRVFQIE